MKHRNFENGRIGIIYLIALFSFMALGLLLVVSRDTSADGYDLPPRENPATTTPTEAVQPNGQGARVHLHAHFSQDWPWDTLHWQEDLWLKVQWLDDHGTWQDVEGWQGTLDGIQQMEDWLGMKELWLADAHLGTGPYRWQVLVREDGRILATSDQFYLPSKGGDLLTVEMMLEP